MWIFFLWTECVCLLQWCWVADAVDQWHWHSISAAVVNVVECARNIVEYVCLSVMVWAIAAWEYCGMYCGMCLCMWWVMLSCWCGWSAHSVSTAAVNVNGMSRECCRMCREYCAVYRERVVGLLYLFMSAMLSCWCGSSRKSTFHLSCCNWLMRCYRDPASHRSDCLLHGIANSQGGLVAEWLACSTQALKGPGSNRSRDAVR